MGGNSRRMVAAGESFLAPYAACAAAGRGRRHPEPEHPYRNAYQRDRDRIVHSTAFRRLEYKTQVFVNYEGDHYRTRLTHTLEVAQISRSLARALCLNEDLTEAIALAHDLGHTPFGHSGEEALDTLMREHGGFEHNAQGLRVVSLLEHRYPDFPGLNLTYEVREGFASHSTRHRFDRTGTEFPPDERPSLEAQIVILADEIAYNHHDLDDGLASGLLQEEELYDLALWRHALRDLGPELHNQPPGIRRSQLIRSLINFSVTDTILASAERLRDAGIQSLEDVRRHTVSLIGMGPEQASMKEELEQFLRDRFYNHFTVRRMANKAAHFLTEMFHYYAQDSGMLPPEHQAAAAEYGLERAVCDYIAGMTDRYAQQEYRRLFHPFELP